STEWARNLAETAAFHNTAARVPIEAGGSLVGAGVPVEARLDAVHELIADLPIGVELLLATAAEAGRIRGGPIFHLHRQCAGELERGVMRLGRKRHDEVEIEPLPFLEFLDRHRPV